VPTSLYFHFPCYSSVYHMHGYRERLTERKWIPIHFSGGYFSSLYQQTAAWHVAQLFLCVIHTQPTESDHMELNSEGGRVLDTTTMCSYIANAAVVTYPSEIYFHHHCTLRYKILLSLEPHSGCCKCDIFSLCTPWRLIREWRYTSTRF
jgi:hypothetical protein